MLKRFMMVVAGAGLLTACGGGSDFLKVANESADKICACKDLECASKVELEMAGQMMKMMEGKSEEEMMKAMANDAEKIEAARKKAEDCKAKFAPADGAAPAPAEGEGH